MNNFMFKMKYIGGKYLVNGHAFHMRAYNKSIRHIEMIFLQPLL